MDTKTKTPTFATEREQHEDARPYLEYGLSDEGLTVETAGCGCCAATSTAKEATLAVALLERLDADLGRQRYEAKSLRNFIIKHGRVPTGAEWDEYRRLHPSTKPGPKGGGQPR